MSIGKSVLKVKHSPTKVELPTKTKIYFEDFTTKEWNNLPGSLQKRILQGSDIHPATLEPNEWNSIPTRLQKRIMKNELPKRV